MRLEDEIVRVQTDPAVYGGDPISEIYLRKLPGTFVEEEVFFTDFATLSMKDKIVRLKRYNN